MREGWMKFYRSQVDWRWFKFPETAHLWHYLLLAAEYEKREIGKMIVERGQLLTTISDISEATGLSLREIRTGLQRLEETGEIMRKSTNKNTLITLVKYEEYQAVPTNERQTKDKRKTNLPIKERNKEVKKLKDKKEKDKKEKPDFLDLVKNETKDEKIIEAAMGWIEMRIAKSRPPTENAIHLAFQKLEKISKSKEETIAIFNESTLNGWTGLFPLKE